VKALLILLIRLFPSGFRAQFGPDMAAQIAREHEHARARGGAMAVLFALTAALDLIGSALAERISPTWVDPSMTRHNTRAGWPMSGWIQDLKLAARGLKRTPGFTAIAIGTLGLAIGANAGIFSVVDTVLLRPLAFPESDRLVYIGASMPGTEMTGEFGVAQEFYVQYSERSELLDNVALFTQFTNTLRVDDRAERVWMSVATTSLFNTLGVAPALGRMPVEEDESRVMLISHALWTSWFGSDPEVIGRTFHAGGGDRTVIGVMGPEFRFPDDRVLLWIPSVVRVENIVPGRFGQPLVGRLAPGATEEALVAELTGLARELPERFGGSANYARLITHHRPVVRPLKEQVVGNVSTALWVLLGSVGIVLLIACVNVANLFLVRAERRQRDLAIRRAIGAGRGQLFRSQMTEALLVALAAGVLAVGLASAGVPALVRAAPPNIPRLGDVAITAPTLLFTLAVALVTALLCGLAPALRSARPRLASLRESSRGSTRRKNWGRDGLVVAQTALALVLLIGSGLLIRSFHQLRNVDPGYDTANIYTFQIAPEGASLTDGPSFARFHMDFMDRIRALPGVESVGVVENVPLDESVATLRFRTQEMAADPEAGTLLGRTFAGGDYYSTMGIAVLRGRAFVTADHVSEPGNVVISESAANQLWPGTDPIGRRLQLADADTWNTVVGVVEDVMQYTFRDSPLPLVYFPLVGPEPRSWAITSPAYVVKTSRAETIGPEILALVREAAPGAPMYRTYTMAGLAAGSMVQLSFTMLTLGITSMLALILGTVGLYGVLSYVVAERTREIGVRMALGAEASRVRRMVVAEGARVVVLGVAAGALVAALCTRALGTLLFEVGALDVTTFLAMSAAMVAVGLLASYVPARRASSVDPVESLREG
jgi:putative ABC transport system permease protein